MRRLRPVCTAAQNRGSAPPRLRGDTCSHCLSFASLSLELRDNDPSAQRQPRPPSPQPPPLGHRPLQPALQLLHARAGVRVAAARGHPPLRGNRDPRRRLHRLGVDKVRLTGGEPLLRRDLPDLVARLAARPAIRDLAMTTNGVLLAANAPRASRRRPAPADRQPRHAAPGALPRSDPLRRARSRPRGHRHRCAALPRPQDRHRRHQRRQRRRAGRSARVRPPASAPRCGSSSTWTSAAPRTGRWRASMPRREMLDAARAALRPDHAGHRGVIGARRSLPPAGRHDLRHHLVDDGAVLRFMRPQPADGRWPVVSVPLRDARHRPASAAALGGVGRSAGAADSRHVGSAQRPRRRGAARGARPLTADPGGSAEARSRTSRCIREAANCRLKGRTQTRTARAVRGGMRSHCLSFAF